MPTLSGSDSVMKALEAIAKKMGGGSVSVGFMEGAAYPDGTPVAAVAFWNEYGVPEHNQPPRPFFRTMIAEDSKNWPAMMAGQAKVTNYDGPKVLARMGEAIGGALRQSINEFTTPALAPSTLAARIGKSKAGSYNPETVGKPLIDTAVMVNSIYYQVNNDEKVHIE